MVSHWRALLMALLFLTGGAAAPASTPGASTAGVERVEPPNWWVGMRHPELQLLIEGPGVAALRPRLRAHRGVRLAGSRPGDGPNHLFVFLQLAPDAAAGLLRIELQGRAGQVLPLDYPLLAREPGSAQRRGFGPQDAVYLVVPDRFAQGGHRTPLSPDADFSDAVDRSQALARHGGDIEGLRQRLGYIADMGFTMLWCTPLTENAMPRMSYHGYAPTDLYRIDARFGSNEDYRRLVAEARAKGIGVIHDIILNHIGDRHRWLRPEGLPTRDWINPRRLTNHAHIAVLDPHRAQDDLRGMVDGWFVNSMPDLNTRQPLLGEYLIQNTLWWIEWAGLSGIREDTYSYADKDFLARWSGRVMAEYPRFALVGEEMSDHAPMVAYWQRGQRNHDGYISHMPSMMDFPLVAALRKGLLEPEGQGGQMKGFFDIYQALGFDFVYPDPGMLMLFDGNHDTTRLLAELQGDLDLARMALAFVATVPRIPQFFYGTELALRGPYPRDDGALRADMPGGFAGDAVSAFSGQGLAPEQAAMQRFVRTLLNERKREPLLHGGRLTQYLPSDGVYAYFRHAPGQQRRVMVAMNKNATAAALELARFAEMLPAGSRWQARDWFSGERFALGERLEIPARGLRILVLSPAP
ncbi:MAG: cyclomaltodextrinase N-terminal domain-containing protein [Inhella sp.]|nr:cyclomaltodextrinase N-terminal domain-containing protein [Inhella sp.]